MRDALLSASGAIRAILAAAVIMLALSCVPSTEAAGRATVTEIKHWSNPAYTRIVITLDKKAAFTYKLLQKDPTKNIQHRRLVVDMSGAVISPSIQKSIRIEDGLLKDARAAQFDKETARVVLDIESIKDFKVFSMDDPFKIIIDVTGEKKEEPAKDAKDKAAAHKAVPALRVAPAAEAPIKVRRLVIDPGHGGKDPGAVGKNGLMEKEVTLRLGKMLREKLATKLNSKIIMTRDTDVFIPLEERTAIANSQDADFFISIHINSSPRRTASGVETYLLNVSGDEESRRVAARENATSKKALSDLEFILNDLIKTAKTNDSARLASAVHEGLVKKLKENYKDIKSNGVKGAPFYVLVGTKMPSILVEVTYISNPSEEKRLHDEKYLRDVVEGITNGLMSYINGQGSI